MDFWSKLKRPIFVMAPMANVTDSVFRALFAKYGKPDVTWTEFVSADGLISPGRKVLLKDLEYSEKERPIVAQLFTGHPDAMKKAAALAKKLKFDGVDINMGCPDRSVEKQGGGAAHIKDPKMAIKVLNAAREGAKGLPVSIKTRIGYNAYDTSWIKTLFEQKLPALTVHLRTRKEMSNVPAHWELMPEIVKCAMRSLPEPSS
jgi:tRNA-dihydrouridine synthase